MPQDTGNADGQFNQDADLIIGMIGIVVTSDTPLPDYIMAAPPLAESLLIVGAATLGTPDEQLCSEGCHVLQVAPIMFLDEQIGIAIVGSQESTPEDRARLGSPSA